MINFEEVSFIREGNNVILDTINWQVKPKENWAILGLNGSGKTTLLQLITGYLWPTKGGLTVLGQRFGQTSIPDLRKQIGWVSSALSYQMKGHFLAEDIVLSGKFATIGIHQIVTAEEQQAARELLATCGGQHLIGKRFDVMSQGQRQITLIARALMAKPPLLILDEPCNGLDLFAREQLLERIEAIANTPDAPNLLFVTHYTEELLPCFDQLMLLMEGKIFEQGQTVDLLTKDKLENFYDKPVKLVPMADNRVTVVPN
ncbi:ABC transporter ATP-binding protein [uncultured Vagococcus sp.]|uniref:ABC transporter ATP-binding protein n=1 Tax=uncultured Vagococcus sp. TaxID=189676 RepID=UPI0028D76884|nr:ABC transporter ATP-binding protein [uncultured Vagococcus sp.]